MSLKPQAPSIVELCWTGVALGQAQSLDDPDWRQLLIAIADWRTDFSDAQLSSMPKFSELVTSAQQLKLGFKSINLLSDLTPMTTRLRWGLIPPVFLAALLFLAQWSIGGLRVQAAELMQQQQAQQQADAEQQAQAAAAQATAQRQYTLEIRGIGLTVERFRQHQVWDRLNVVNHPQKSILSQNPNDYKWSREERNLVFSRRENDALMNAINWWGERWPIPVLIAGPGPFHPSGHLNSAGATAGMGITLYTLLGERKGEGADQLINTLFKWFDDNPDLPAVVVMSWDTQERRPKEASQQTIGSTHYPGDGYFVPTLPDSIGALLVSRSDRVDRIIRPHVVDVPYDINLEDTQYDVIKLWNAYWKADRDRDAKMGYGPEEPPIMPWDYWRPEAEKLIAGIDPNGSQGNFQAFWSHEKTGFKPSPWVPVRWTKWQMEEYDKAPRLGYLHRPVDISLTDAHQTPLSGAEQAKAVSHGWKAAMATLPSEKAPAWLLYDTGKDRRHVIALSRGLALADPEHALDPGDAQHSFNLIDRIGDTGVSSPFVLLTLAVMRSYDQGGVSATVNLRQAERASIIMVSPPSEADKARNVGPLKANPFQHPNPFAGE